jgi:threonylcarbamoyladenosine tRNA methylthiotransferase MtaB
VQWIKTALPHACIGVDVIVGFPGESNDDFLDTYHFLNNLDISYLHVFTYSERANTPAAELPGAVPMDVRRERNEQLRILSAKKRRAFTNPFLGSTRTVLLEHGGDPGRLSGYTDNYIKVSVPYKADLLNTLADVRLNDYNDSQELVQASWS